MKKNLYKTIKYFLDCAGGAITGAAYALLGVLLCRDVFIYEGRCTGILAVICVVLLLLRKAVFNDRFMEEIDELLYYIYGDVYYGSEKVYDDYEGTEFEPDDTNYTHGFYGGRYYDEETEY